MPEFCRHIIDDIFQGPGWLVIDQTPGFIEAGDAPLHVFKPVAIGFVIRDITDLTAAGGHFNGLFRQCLNRNLGVIADIYHLPKAFRRFRKFDQGFDHIKDVPETA